MNLASAEYEDGFAAVVGDIRPIAEPPPDDSHDGAQDWISEAEYRDRQRNKAVAAALDKIRVQAEAREQFQRERVGKLILPAVESLTEFLAEPDPPTAYRVEGLQPAGGRALLTAQAKSGKTTVVGNLLRALVDGENFLGKFETAPVDGTVVLIDDELHRDQLRRWLRQHRIEGTDHVRVVALRGKLSTFDIVNADVRAQWAAALRELDARYVILDCLRPVLDALSLDEKSEAGKFLVAFDELLGEADVPEALVVQHMGHQGERSRGDSRIQDWPDAIWTLVRDGEDTNAARYLSAFGRDVDQREGRLMYDPATRQLTFTQSSRSDAGAEAALDDVLAVLGGEDEGISGRQVEAAVIERADHSRNAIRGALALALGGGLTEWRPGPKNSKLHRLVAQCPRCERPIVGGHASTHLSCEETSG